MDPLRILHGNDTGERFEHFTPSNSTYSVNRIKFCLFTLVINTDREYLIRCFYNRQLVMPLFVGYCNLDDSMHC